LCGSLYQLKIQIQCRHITITAGGHNSRQVKFSVARIKWFLIIHQNFKFIYLVVHIVLIFSLEMLMKIKNNGFVWNGKDVLLLFFLWCFCERAFLFHQFNVSNYLANVIFLKRIDKVLSQQSVNLINVHVLAVLFIFLLHHMVAFSHASDCEHY